MESIDIAQAEPGPAPVATRASKRLRKRPSYFMPGCNYEASAEDDVKFQATVTDFKGFRDFQDKVSFRGLNMCGLFGMTRNRVRHQTEFEKLSSLMQLKNKDSSKLRLYKLKKPPTPPKKPEVKEVPKEIPRPAQPPAQQVKLPQQQGQVHPANYPFCSPQDVAMAYMMMFYSNPWFYMQPPFQ